MPRRPKDTKNSLKNHFVSLGREEMIRDIRSLSDVETSLDVFPSTPLRERNHVPCHHSLRVFVSSWQKAQIILSRYLFTLRDDARFDIVKLELEILKTETDLGRIVAYISKKLLDELGKSGTPATTLAEFQEMFTGDLLEKPSSSF